MALWKKILLRSAGFGGGFALVFVLIAWLFIWWSDRPKEWSSNALTAKPTELSVSTADEVLHIHFRYALTNNTKTDYSVPDPEFSALMKKLPEDSSLEKLDGATWDKSVTIPPHQSVNVNFDVPFNLSTYSTSKAELDGEPHPSSGQPSEKYVAFISKRLKDMNGLVLMDYSSRYRVDLPSNWQNTK